MNARTPVAEGTRVGDLVIVRLLAEGASGMLYLAEDPAIGTRFAVKQCAPPDSAHERAFADALERFRAEGRLLARLDHPGVAKALRLIEAHGTAWIVMPHRPGRTLRERLESDGPLDPEQARALLLSLMETLEYLHGEGVLHLDIKPANIYLPDDARPLLLDFGAAVAALGAGDGRPARLGSPGYAAPEQSDPGAELGPWTDAYALAATLCRCLSGTVPPGARQRRDALDAGRSDPIEPQLKAVASRGSDGLEVALREALALDPGRRPRSVTRWRRAFQGIDWRRGLAAHTAAGDDASNEERERLPIVLLAVVALVLAAVAAYLVLGPDTRLALPEPAAGPDRTAPTGGPPPILPEETARWEAALEADTVLGYRRFMEDFPRSRYLSQARIQLDILDDRAWQRLSAENTRSAYQDYLETFTTGRHQAEALQRIEAMDEAAARAERERVERERAEREAWQAASSAGTIEALDGYLADWPGGAHAEEAREQRRGLLDLANHAGAWRSARQLDTSEAYQAYIDAYPQGEHVAEALERIDALTLRPGRRFRDCPECPELVVVPAGSFRQGSEADAPLALNLEKPAHTVTIPAPLAVGVFEVTLAQWDACVDAGGCATRPTDNGWGRGRRPAIMVSWDDAHQYVTWLGEVTGETYRLPSESEWEYAARAGQEGPWPGGSPERVCDHANIAGAETGFDWQHEACEDPQALGTLPVGSLEPNGFGLYDVIGNVAEWTADCLNLSYLDAPTDGSAWGRGICSSHITRGGSWVTGTREIRLPARFNLANGDRNDFTGLRVVRELRE